MYLWHIVSVADTACDSTQCPLSLWADVLRVDIWFERMSCALNEAMVKLYAVCYRFPPKFIVFRRDLAIATDRYTAPFRLHLSLFPPLWPESHLSLGCSNAPIRPTCPLHPSPRLMFFSLSLSLCNGLWSSCNSVSPGVLCSTIQNIILLPKVLLTLTPRQKVTELKI